MPDWNRIVDEMTAEYGDKIQFVKVDGTRDHRTGDRYGVQYFPHFIALEPGSKGDAWKEWNPVDRNYLNMKKWIKSLVERYHLQAAPKLSAAEQADKLKDNHVLNAPIPLVEG